MKSRKCKICKKRNATTRHAKDYNHNNPLKSNFAKLDEYCHTAFHKLNEKNNLDSDYMIKNKKQEIIELADKIFQEEKLKGGRRK